jgi:hypothetical protein
MTGLEGEQFLVKIGGARYLGEHLVAAGSLDGVALDQDFGRMTLDRW